MLLEDPPGCRVKTGLAEAAGRREELESHVGAQTSNRESGT